MSRLPLVIALILILAPLSADTGVPLGLKLDLRDVTVGGEIGRRIDVTVNNNLMVIDVDRDFLDPFRTRDKGEVYIGLGKLIDSMVRAAAHTGNEALIKRKDYLIAETIKTQEPDGYIGIFPPKDRVFGLWDIHEMVYLVNGFVSDYEYFGHKESLEAARRVADYVITRWSVEPDRLASSIHITVFMAVTGLEESFLMLHDATGDKKYLDFVTDFRKLRDWPGEIVLGRWGPVAGHAYAFLHRCLAQLRLYQKQPDERLLAPTRRALDFMLKQDGLTINGVASIHECWHDNQDGSAGLGETCSTAYLIRVLDELLRMEGNALYGDVMERSILNGLFAAQSPDGRRLRYYVPFEEKRVYWKTDTYCCPCNYRRIVAELPGMIYYTFGDALAVNLYTQSEAKVKLPGREAVTIRQETGYPNSGDVTIHVDPSTPSKFSVWLRIPRWSRGAEASVNGQDTARDLAPGLFYKINRRWQAGDKIELNMPMPVRLVKGRKAQAGRVALMRGPQVFTLGLSRNKGLEELDLRKIVIDPATITGPTPDEAVRKDGRAISVKAVKEMNFSTGGDHDLNLLLTEFADPDAVSTYFLVRRPGEAGEDDELIR